jgi:hypothetical protein
VRVTQERTGRGSGVAGAGADEIGEVTTAVDPIGREDREGAERLVTPESQVQMMTWGRASAFTGQCGPADQPMSVI